MKFWKKTTVVVRDPSMSDEEIKHALTTYKNSECMKAIRELIVRLEFNIVEGASDPELPTEQKRDALAGVFVLRELLRQIELWSMDTK